MPRTSSLLAVVLVLLALLGCKHPPTTQPITHEADAGAGVVPVQARTDFHVTGSPTSLVGFEVSGFAA